MPETPGSVSGWRERSLKGPTHGAVMHPEVPSGVVIDDGFMSPSDSALEIRWLCLTILNAVAEFDKDSLVGVRISVDHSGPNGIESDYSIHVSMARCDGERSQPRGFDIMRYPGWLDPDSPSRRIGSRTGSSFVTSMCGVVERIDAAYDSNSFLTIVRAAAAVIVDELSKGESRTHTRRRFMNLKGRRAGVTRDESRVISQRTIRRRGRRTSGCRRG